MSASLESYILMEAVMNFCQSHHLQTVETNRETFKVLQENKHELAMYLLLQAFIRSKDYFIIQKQEEIYKEISFEHVPNPTDNFAKQIEYKLLTVGGKARALTISKAAWKSLKIHIDELSHKEEDTSCTLCQLV